VPSLVPSVSGERRVSAVDACAALKSSRSMPTADCAVPLFTSRRPSQNLGAVRASASLAGATALQVGTAGPVGSGAARCADQSAGGVSTTAPS
jgi:hypothetical protein